MKQQNMLKIWCMAVLASMLLIGGAMAQTATIYGSLGNFDIINNTGHDAHGFEIELEGIQANDVSYSFSYQRYGSASIIPTQTGVIVRWTSTYDNVAQRFNATTVAYARGASFGGTCYMGQPNYDAAGCEHFGIGMPYAAQPTRVIHRWLLADPATPGALIGNPQAAAIPVPAYVVLPPVRAGEPAQLEAEFEAPEPAEAPELYGDAQWVKVFKTQLNRNVSLDELVTTNAIVPQNAAQIETEWDLVQAEPASNGNRRRHRNQGALDPTTRAVVRRYEVYQFTGAYDPTTHQAVCADLTCSAPAANEVGDFLGAQMAAANVEVNAAIVAVSGGGSVSSSDRLISCGNKCAATYNAGSQVTLTADAGKLAFVGWTGACTGTNLNCVVTVNGQTNVSATFVPYFSFTAKTSGKGTISCGTAACASKYAQGTNLTLTARPEAGFRFIGWTGACTGTATTCNLTVNSNLTAQANFAK